MRQLLFLRDSRKWAIRKRDSRKRAALPGRPLRSGIFDVAAACGLRPAACDPRPAGRDSQRESLPMHFVKNGSISHDVSS